MSTVAFLLAFLSWMVLEVLTMVWLGYWDASPRSPDMKKIHVQLGVFWLVLIGLFLVGYAAMEPLWPKDF